MRRSPASPAACTGPEPPNAGGAGARAGAARPDRRPAGAVREGDAAATGPALGDVDAGGADDPPAPADEPVADGQGRPDLVLGAVADAAVLDQGRLGRRPAH